MLFVSHSPLLVYSPSPMTYEYGLNCLYYSLDSVSIMVLTLYRILKQDPSLTPIVRPQFPRSHMKHAFLENIFGFSSQNIDPDDWDDISSDQVRVIKLGWEFCDSLETLCQVDQQCMRRGCRKKRRARCKDCLKTEYCGPICQKECVAVRRSELPFISDVLYPLTQGTGRNIASHADCSGMYAVPSP